MNDIDFRLDPISIELVEGDAIVDEALRMPGVEAVAWRASLGNEVPLEAAVFRLAPSLGRVVVARGTEVLARGDFTADAEIDLERDGRAVGRAVVKAAIEHAVRSCGDARALLARGSSGPRGRGLKAALAERRVRELGEAVRIALADGVHVAAPSPPIINLPAPRVTVNVSPRIVAEVEMPKPAAKDIKFTFDKKGLITGAEVTAEEDA